MALLQLQLLVLDSNTGKHLTLCKQMNSYSFKNNVTYKLFIYKSYIYIIYIEMNNKYLALNNLQGLICHKTQPTIQYYKSKLFFSIPTLCELFRLCILLPVIWMKERKMKEFSIILYVTSGDTN